MSALSRKSFLRAVLALTLGASALSACTQPDVTAQVSAEPSAATFYLVRHAEKELKGDDPELSEAGYARAQALADTLRGAKLTGIYSTDTRRTRDTAAPTLAETNLDLQLYDGRSLTDFAQQMSNKEGNFLIVGHSNTTPQLAQALGGEGGEPIVEATEYDRLYVITNADGVVTTDLRRYP